MAPDVEPPTPKDIYIFPARGWGDVVADEICLMQSRRYCFCRLIRRQFQRVRGQMIWAVMGGRGVWGGRLWAGEAYGSAMLAMMSKPDLPTLPMLGMPGRVCSTPPTNKATDGPGGM